MKSTYLSNLDSADVTGKEMDLLGKPFSAVAGVIKAHRRYIIKECTIKQKWPGLPFDKERRPRIYPHGRYLNINSFSKKQSLFCSQVSSQKENFL